MTVHHIEGEVVNEHLKLNPEQLVSEKNKIR